MTDGSSAGEGPHGGAEGQERAERGRRPDRGDATSGPTTVDAVLGGLERHAIALVALASAGVLLVIFYYPVATVLADAIWQAGRLTTAPLRAVLTDPFYTAVPLGRLTFGLVGESGELGLVPFTAYQAALSTVLSVALGLPGAYVLARWEFRGRRLLRSLTILPFVMPSIMVAIGFVATFGQRGTVNATLVALGAERVEFLYRLEVILLAHAFYNAPLVTRLTTAAWESVDVGMVETARSLGAGPRRAFLDVVYPQLRPAILTGAVLTFVFTFMTFPIVLALGGLRLATLEVWIYAMVRDLNYAEAASLAVLETAITLGLTYAYLRYEARQRTRTRAVRTPPRYRLVPLAGTRPLDRLRAMVRSPRRLGVLAYAAVVAVVFVGPIASMLLASVTGPEGLTLRYYEFLLQRQVEGYAFQVKPLAAIENSLFFAAGSLLVALPMGVVVAVLSTREFRGRKVVDALAMAPLAVSGIVVGLGMLRGLVFGIPVGDERIRIGGALAIVAAHAVAAYPFVTRNVTPQLAGLDPAMVESARSLGASRVRALVDVELPLVAAGVAAGAAFAVAISIGEFDSTVILATGGQSYTMPVAVERYIGGRTLGPATAMGSVLLVVTSAAFVVIDRLGGRWAGLD